MYKTCPFCDSSKLEAFRLDYTVFFHQSFEDFGKALTLFRCEQCQLVANVMMDQTEEKLKAIYLSPQYAKAPISNQTFLLPSGQRVNRFHIQADLLHEYLVSRPQLKVLDIGCFKGGFLLELMARFPNGEFHGFDVNPYVKEEFPRLTNFHFWLEDLAAINQQFDLISTSFSLMYIKDIKGVLANIRRMLKPDGHLYIQLVDFKQNPYSLLLADQYYHFTPRILENVLNKAGFSVKFLYNEHFARDIVALAHAEPAPQNIKAQADLTIKETIHYLNAVKTKLQAIAAAAKVCVLGTTTIAAFVDSILGDCVEFFVDENIDQKQGVTSFRHKKVYSPKTVDLKTYLILPYGVSNQKIAERFSKEYNLKNFIYV